jgi:hypothetical protein
MNQRTPGASTGEFFNKIRHKQPLTIQNATSAPPRTPDIVNTGWHVSKVPNPEVANTNRPKKKPPEGGSQFNPDDRNQTAINAGFNFRRYAMKPMPAKPRIIIAQVEGSGTAPTSAPNTPGLNKNWPPKSEENVGSIKPVI